MAYSGWGKRQGYDCRAGQREAFLQQVKNRFAL
jgi:hypothetical protein